MKNIPGLFQPYQAGGRFADIGEGNPYLKRHGLEPREFSRFSASMAANLGSRSSLNLYNPSENLSINSLYYAPTARMGMPRSNQAIKMSIRGMMGTSIRTIMGYSHGHVPSIEGLHPGSNGYSKSMIQGITHFGSGFDASKAVGFSLTNPVTSGFINMLLFGKPTFASKRRMAMLGLYTAGLGYSRAGIPGIAVGLGALAGIYGTANYIENRISEDQEYRKTASGQMLEFMTFGAISGGLEAAASAGILGGTGPGNLLKNILAPTEKFYSGLSSKYSFLPKGHIPGEAVPGLAPELQQWVSPLRKYYQKSILESAESFQKWGGRLGLDISNETYLKFSEAFHGESAYVLREAAAAGGVEKIPKGLFYKALGKDITAGAIGGLLEHTLVGGAYLGIGWAINQVFRGPWRHRVAQQPAIDNPYTLPGLHPGNAGYATSYIRGMTSFGSQHDPFKAINLGQLIYSPNATSSREWVQRTLGQIHGPNANIIGFDVETGGLLPHLLPTTELGASPTNILEFAIQSSKGKSYGFTKYASSELYGSLAAEPGDFSKQFAEAGERFGQYIAGGGKLYSSSAIAKAIGKHMIPGKTNILLGHNINWFDLPMLSSDIALEQGFIKPGQLHKLRSFGVPSKYNKEFNLFYDQVIRSGWKKANASILKTWREHGSNLTILDTLGTTRTTKFTETMLPYSEAQLGLMNQIQLGYYPGIHKYWHEHFYKKAISEGRTIEEATRYASQQAMFAAKVGTSAEESMKLFGQQFIGQAHNPIFDVANELELAKSKALKSRLNAYDFAINNKAEAIVTKEHIRRLTSQQAKARATIIGGSIREGKLNLAQEMSSTISSSGIEAKAVEYGFKAGFTKWWSGLSTLGKFGWGAGIAGVGYLGLKALFAPRTKYVNQQVNGLHPGRNRPDWMNGIGFGSGKIFSEIMSLSTEMLMGTRPAIKSGGEIFKAANHGEAFLKAMASTSRFSEQYMGNKLEQGFFIPGKGFISRSGASRYGFETSEELYKLQGIHPGDRGIATNQVRSMTDFGSGLDTAKMLLRRIWQSAMGAEEAIAPEYKTIIDTEKYQMPTALKMRISKRVREKLHETPTAGLVNIVLHDNSITHHKSFNRMPIP